MKLLFPLTALFLLTATLPALRADDLPRAKAEEEAAVRALIGKKATITGKVTDAFESPKGMTFLNLDGGKFTVVAWKESYAKFEGGSPAKLYEGKTIEVTGPVDEYRPRGASKDDPGKLQIKLNTPEQIKVLTAPEPAGDDKKEDAKDAKEKTAKSKKDFKEKKNGKDEKASPDEKPDADKKDAKPTADQEKPERVDPKKFFK
jgi:hypothetical protein